MLRLFVKGKDKEFQQELYRSYATELAYTFHKYDIPTLSKLILTETDPYLRAYECESLSHKLVGYQGPIDLEYLDQMLAIFSISGIRRLAAGAEFGLIKEKAQAILDQKLEPQDYNSKKKAIEKRKQK